MAIFALLVDVSLRTSTREEWRSAAMEYGGPSTMRGAGIVVMLLLSVDNLDTTVISNII